MADDEEPFVLDSQEERELRAQVCLLAAEVTLCVSYPITNTHTQTRTQLSVYIRCVTLHVPIPMCEIIFETWVDALLGYIIKFPQS